MTPVAVKLAYDVEARVRSVDSSDLPGLNLEATTNMAQSTRRDAAYRAGEYRLPPHGE